MRTIKELKKYYENVDIEKEIKEKRLMSDEDVWDYLSEVKFIQDLFFHVDLYSEMFGDNNNPFKLNNLIIQYKGKDYTLRESLESEINRVSKIVTELNRVSKQFFRVLEECTV